MSQSVASLKTTAILDNLEDVQAFVCQQAKALGAADALLFKIELVIEELFVNIATHARPGIVPEVEIACALDDSAQAQKTSFCVSLRDWEPPFNPLEAAPPSIDQDVDERPIGGLGIHLVTRMTDRCTYAWQDESNLFTACFDF